MSRNVRVLNNRVLEIIYLKLVIYDLLDKVFFTLQVRSEMSWDTLKKPPMPGGGPIPMPGGPPIPGGGPMPGGGPSPIFFVVKLLLLD